MNFADPHVQASLWALAFVLSELIGASRMRENSLVQLGLKVFRIAHGRLAKKVSK